MILLPPVFFIIYNSIPLIQPGRFNRSVAKFLTSNGSARADRLWLAQVSIAQSRSFLPQQGMLVLRLFSRLVSIAQSRSFLPQLPPVDMSQRVRSMFQSLSREASYLNSREKTWRGLSRAAGFNRSVAKLLTSTQLCLLWSVLISRLP